MSLNRKQDLEREKEERKDAELSVAAFKRQLAALKERCASIEVEIEQYRAITGNLRRGPWHTIFFVYASANFTAERNKEHSTLSTHASRVSPELEACERRLSCIVEGIEKDQLLIRFWLVDPSEPQREFSFVMDISDTVYKGELPNILPSNLADRCSYNVITPSPIITYLSGCS